MPNETKYLEDGSMVTVLHMFEGGAVVEPTLIDAEGDDYVGDPIFVPCVYDQPPRRHYDAGIEALKKTAADLRAEINGMRQEAKSVEAYLKDLAAQTKQYPELDTLLGFVRGEIKWVVETDWRDIPQVKPFDEVLQYREGGLRLVGLFGIRDRKTAWRLNQYRDGSGSWTEIYPCRTKEEAEVYAAAKLQQAPISEKVIDAAKERGVTLPADKVAEWREKYIAGLLESRTAHEKALAQYDAKIAKAKGRTDAE